MTGACAICAWTNDPVAPPPLEAWRCARWVVRHHAHPAPLPGWFLLCAMRHVQGAADLTDLEASELGPVLRAASRAVRSATGCDRVYAIAFGQGAPHLHIHLAPRHDEEPGTRAWSVADWYRAVEAGERPAADATDVARAVERAGEELRRLAVGSRWMEAE